MTTETKNHRWVTAEEIQPGKWFFIANHFCASIPRARLLACKITGISDNGLVGLLIITNEGNFDWFFRAEIRLENVRGGTFRFYEILPYELQSKVGWAKYYAEMLKEKSEYLLSQLAAD